MGDEFVLALLAAVRTLALTTEVRHADPKRLTRACSQVYSQCFEDGIIAEIFARIGTRTRTFLEIGVESGVQSTSRLLLEQG